MKYLGKGSVASFLRIALTVIWSLGIAMAVIFLILSIVMIVFGPPKGFQFDFGSNTGITKNEIMAGKSLPHTSHFTLDADFVDVEFTNIIIIHPKQLLGIFLPFGAIMIGLGMAVIYQLRKIFATLAAGDPFVLDNAKRMRKIGLLIFGGVFVKLIAGSIIGWFIMENVIIKGVTFNMKGDLNVGGLFIGLVILILAEIFRQGALLKEEQDLTI